MTDYMRKIIYLSKIEQGISIPGAGHIRLERKREYLFLSLRVTEGSIPEGSPVYGIYKKNGQWNQLEFGKFCQDSDRWEKKIRLFSLPDREVGENIAGVYIGTTQLCWTGEEPGAQIPFSKFSQQPCAQHPLESAEEPAEESVAEHLMEVVESPQPELQAAEMYPFEDDEMAWCRQIGPEDLSSLPMPCWRMGNNSFLLQGYYSYRHLLYAGDGKRCYVGVPGQYHRREQYLARQFGFPRFKATRKKRVTMGDFGYWLQDIGGDEDDQG